MNEQSPSTAESNTSLFRKRLRGVRVKDDADIADYLEVIKKEDEERFFTYLAHLPLKLQAQTVIELPGPFQVDLIEKLQTDHLARLVTSLPTDDATDFMQLILEVDNAKGEAVFELLPGRLQQVIRKLMTYEEDQAGALMQTELFSARLGETIQNSLRRLRKMKAEQTLESVEYVLVVDDQNRLQAAIPLSELILVPSRKRYADIVGEFPSPHIIRSDASVDEAVQAIDRYDLAMLPVVDRFGHLLGKITHDDVVDMIQQRATEQMYGLGQVSGEEELHASVFRTGRSRALWLAINLVNVTLVSIVIGFFEEVLDAVVALAVLMPIVANMAGTASVQTLTVMVRQIALGELTPHNALLMFRKEFTISAVNGVLFGLLAMAISYWRFGSVVLGLVMAMAMMVSFIAAGVFGAGVPVLLRRLGVDPAVASSTLVITLMDVVGFFSFLWFATFFLRTG